MAQSLQCYILSPSFSLFISVVSTFIMILEIQVFFHCYSDKSSVKFVDYFQESNDNFIGLFFFICFCVAILLIYFCSNNNIYMLCFIIYFALSLLQIRLFIWSLKKKKSIMPKWKHYFGNSAEFDFLFIHLKMFSNFPYHFKNSLCCFHVFLDFPNFLHLFLLSFYCDQ